MSQPASTIYSATTLNSANPAEVQLPASTNNYLQRRVEELTHSQEHIQNLEWDAQKSKIWAVFTAALSSLVALGIVITVGLFAFPYLPPATGIAVGILSFGYASYGENMKIANEHMKEANYNRDMAQEFQNFEVQNDYMAAVDLSIATGRDVLPSDANTLKPLLADYKYWNRQCDKYQREERADIEAARNETSSDVRVEKYTSANSCRQWGLNAKVSAAFAVAAMQNLGFEKEPKDLCFTTNFRLPADIEHYKPETGLTIFANFKYNAWVTRALHQEFNDPRADQYLVFKDARIAPLSTTEVQTQSIVQIAQRISDAMRLPPQIAPAQQQAVS
jgi:hypothetical protein